ncbi:MAG: DinB family protein [Gemmatimonadales bacterium]
MRTITDGKTMASLVGRLHQLRPDTPRRWGTLTAGEMLCHLGDAHESVLGTRIAPGPPPLAGSHPMLKWLVLYVPVPWPKGVQTRPGVNPRIAGTQPGEFERDRGRAIASLQALAVAAPTTLAGCHFVFGAMSPRDWYRWAYRHVTYHLRQFGL